MSRQCIRIVGIKKEIRPANPIGPNTSNTQVTDYYERALDYILAATQRSLPSTTLARREQQITVEHTKCMLEKRMSTRRHTTLGE